MLTNEQKKRIESNRQKALARLKNRGIMKPSVAKSHVTIHNENVSTESGSFEKRNDNVFEPTAEQRRIIQQNREKAMVRLKSRQGNLRDASGNNNINSVEKKGPLDRIRPSIRKEDYIEYDFSTMKNTYGGFINQEDAGIENDETKLKTLEEWQEEQRNRRKLFEDEPPPIHISLAPKCEDCNVNIEMDMLMKKIFHIQVCKTCVKNHPEKYALLTKTECKQDYFLTDPELNDKALFDRLEKPNPHSGTFSRMQLFVRCQVEKFAFEKWGGEEGLDKEWQRREEGRSMRREKKYQQTLNEMRLKTRAQEYTTRIKELKHGKKHVHEFSEPFDGGKNEEGVDLQRRRCFTCGLEVVEIVL